MARHIPLIVLAPLVSLSAVAHAEAGTKGRNGEVQAPNRHPCSPQLPCRRNRLHEISEILSTPLWGGLIILASPSPGRSIDDGRWRGDRQARGDRPSRGIAAALR
jgi:hypothetical protein